MKNYNYFLTILTITILNTAATLFLVAPFLLFGLGRLNVNSVVLFLPVGVIAAIIIYSSFRAKRLRKKGAFIIPFVISFGIVVWELIFFIATFTPVNTSVALTTLQFVFMLVVTYALFRYYFHLHSLMKNSGM